VSEILKHQNTAKAKNAGLSGTVVRVIVLLVALSAYIASIARFLYTGSWGVHALAFAVAAFVLIALVPEPETLPAIEGEGAATEKLLRLPDWFLLSYCLIVGVSENWICAFLWFSRRCAFFSAPVVGVTAVVIASYGAIALLVALLTGGNWRNGLLVFVVAPFFAAGVVLRLHLLQ
jgi:hypothetical protein